MEAAGLVVVRHGQEHRVALGEVREISETRWSRVKTVTIALRPGSGLGEKIVFIPPLHAFPFLDHPLVKELNQKRGLGGNP
jgi:hypothetical protein